ncbi:MAG: FKBP-type peptidyl-prolyl cis-trans isomerase [Opitutaceae bacterium]|nr:FKBP-type peptidyl-prolyl cis-trans isomerase [Opitutaceae bacterium]
MTKLSAGLVGVGLLVAVSAQDAVKFNVPGVTPESKPAQPAPAGVPAPAAPAAPAAAKAKFTEAQVAEAYGWYLGAQLGLQQLEFTREQVEAVARGMVGSAAGGRPPFDAREIGPEVEAFLGKKNNAFMGRLRQAQLAEGQAFFTKLKENKSVVELPSGLRYEVLKAGTGATPKPGQVVTMHYTGTLATGQTFDSSVERGQPAEIALKDGQIIPGMFEGLQKTSVGGKIKLYVPPSLAYGDEGSQAIPPGATLVFEVELLGVKDAPKEAAPAAK